MEHDHEFEIRDDGADRSGSLPMTIDGTVNSTRYSVDVVAKHDQGEVWIGRNAVKGIAQELEWALLPLCDNVTSDDCLAFAREIRAAAAEYANDYFRESSRRYTPN